MGTIDDCAVALPISQSLVGVVLEQNTRKQTGERRTELD